mmetsp:Transcript_2340/g.5571  ORF Transcript_2340/g.5571 Transcript_2340/m.5571 type:complete len:356 (+) Transcript_2340:176-1243(+)|eukprot:CAMPEP_0206267696 /NCGR_PEP_ID=MMETSP0047_2-20121206/31293_1 /ASSEMBLY_ACC=CAM_ASM_000192 /TAXON_ID=195065 /ORGANISM="Chroomonas mesostigmatica_cf, Strain CCMP1168" /LENGTH=355 /DNA_ID=CAMNT_0053695929 /DNA_START=84 /DNA_END=1151 /DNA_ORIENTATION=+
MRSSRLSLAVLVAAVGLFAGNAAAFGSAGRMLSMPAFTQLNQNLLGKVIGGREASTRPVGAVQGLSMMSPRRRKGNGPQRSRWQPREVSKDINMPQEAVSDDGGEGNRQAKIEALAARKQAGFIVVLEDPHDEGNAGAVVRSCDAFGVTEIWFVHNGLEEGTSMRPHVEREEPFVLDSRGLLLSSASANRWVVSRSFRSTKVALDELKKEGYTNIATCFTPSSISMYSADLTAPKIALWMGNEFEGLSELAIKEADVELFIPMRGMIQSLNLAVSTAVCLNEICRQRTNSGRDEDYFLSEDEQKKIVRHLSMKRRGYRMEMTPEKKVRLQKTWATMVNKSVRAGYVGGNLDIDHQ